MKYLTIIPATDWFFVHENSQPASHAKFTAHRLAAFALSEDGTVVGLLPAAGLPNATTTNAKTMEPPGIKGEYLHLGQVERRRRNEGVNYE
jgi:hypothetical protein